MPARVGLWGGADAAAASPPNVGGRTSWARADFSVESLRIYNSLTDEVEDFLALDVGTGSERSSTDVPAQSGLPIRWYNCGPTVYDSAHLGHARTYVCLDIFRRVLAQHFNLDVLYALGMTDVDDKIINRALEPGSEHRTPLELARHFEGEFFDDLARLGVALPDVVLRVTEHIPDIVEYVAELERKGFAYVNNEDRSVYFDVGAFNAAGHR